MTIQIDDTAAAIARYVDSKADTARNHAKSKPQQAEEYGHVARVLDALADDIRTGLAT